MIKPFILSALVLISVGATAQNFDKIFTTQDWLTAHMDDPNVVILHVGRSTGYTKGHIPGAIYIQANDFVTTSADSLYVQLPEASTFSNTLKLRGIDNNSTVIICSEWQSFAWAFRLYATFKYFGMEDQVKILDGGIKGWSFNGLTVATDSVVAKPASVEVKLIENPAMMVDKNWIKDNQEKDKVLVVDARRTNYYAGEEKGNYSRSGHISMAKNITWTTLVDENHFLIPTDSLRSKFEGAGMTKKKTLVSYCHVGLRASVIYTTALSLGYKAELYDGSYNEWDRLGDDFPVKTGN